jgi:hypothetical protein
MLAACRCALEGRALPEGRDDLGHAPECAGAVQIWQAHHNLADSRLGQFTEPADVVGDGARVDRRRIPRRVAPPRTQPIDQFGDVPVALSDQRRANASALAEMSSSPAPTIPRRRSLETMRSAGKWAAAHVDLPAAPGPASTTTHGAGRFSGCPACPARSCASSTCQVCTAPADQGHRCPWAGYACRWRSFIPRGWAGASRSPSIVWARARDIDRRSGCGAGPHPA